MGRERPQHAPSSFAHQPFKVLRQVVTKPAAQKLPPASRTAPSPESRADPEALFRAAVNGVTPLDERERERVAHPAPALPGRAVTHPDAEALAELCDLVAGNAPFDISDSDEYVEGAMVGIDPRLVRRLRAGEFAYQAHLDLHGMTSDEARRALDGFLQAACAKGKRCVLIIHGRGHNSKDQIPVLKSRVATWLSRGLCGRLVLAFTSARPCDGGAGALYVLLRRQRHPKRPIQVSNGAKR